MHGSCPTPAHPDSFGDDCECVHTITYHWNISSKRLLYAGGHCHAPSCIDIRLFRNDSGTPQLLCRQASKYGQGDFVHDKWDEAGYITLPPCLWGDDEGLDAAPWLPDNTPVFSIKRNRNTHLGHFGEMASGKCGGRLSASVNKMCGERRASCSAAFRRDRAWRPSGKALV